MNIYGLIVGIDRYDQPLWNTSGPARNALLVAGWMAGITEPANIRVFVETLDDLQPQIAALRALGVVVTESAHAGQIETFCFGELKKGRPNDSRLLVFWSGHGYVNPSGDRVFICRDYVNPDFANRVFNGSLFLRHLRSAPFACFSETLLLADVCGTHSRVKIEDPREGPPQCRNARQIAFFATPEGEYAHGEGGEGTFTRVTLSALQEENGWPNLAAFSDSLRAKLALHGQRPFRVSGFDSGDDMLEQIFGKVSGGSLVESVFALLNSVPVSPAKYQFHFRRSANRLTNPALHQAQGLTGMIRELASLQDSGSGTVPFGLLDFLVRLTQEVELRDKINLWLSENAASQASVLQGLRENLLEENGARILLVELDNRQDQLTGFRPYLRTRNLLPVVDEALVPSEVEGWDDFQDQLRRLLATLGTDSIVQIHFLADPPLFDRPFHNLLAPSGSRLGEEFVVVLRHRERVHSRKPHVIAAWNRYADSLRPLASQNVRPVPLPSGPGALVGEDRGMGYFTRLLPATTGGEACSLEEKMLLMNLLRLGVPYLCWLHRASSAGWARQMELFLTACLAKGQTLEQFPDGFTQERLGGQALAMDAALLWDDPGQNPF